jgi:uncharacterized repeat protein (TIGR01451 family)
MKTKLHLVSLFVVLLLTASIRPASAQTNITILEATDSSFGPHCPPPFTTNFFVYAQTTGYSLSDSIAVYFNFGDGTDTTIITPVNTNFWMFASVDHSYYASGQYSVQYIATGPDGNADTVTSYSQVIVGDTCGNVSGTIYIDANNDCIYNAGDTPLPWMNVELLIGTDVVAWSYADSLGNYYFSVPTGYPYTIQMGNYYNNFATVCPASGSYSITTAPSSGNDFALTCSPGYDFSGYVYGSGFRPNAQPAIIWVHADNLRCVPSSGQAQLVLDPLLSYVSASPSPTSVSGDTLTWDFSNLSNYYYNNWWNSFSAYILVLTSPTAVLGDTVCLTLTEESIAGDADPSNNVQQQCYEVRNSWDPNDKSVDPVGLDAGGRIPPSVIKPMDYTIHFQNTGTDVAYNVFIMDTIDSDLDMNTFQVVASSHPMDVDVFPGNVVRFMFNNIMLPDSGANLAASNGFVSYTIKQKEGLPDGTVISNTAGIYFDFNAAVITNTTINTIDASLSVEPLTPSQTSVSIYPNPAATQLTIESGKWKINRIDIYDVLGQKSLTPVLSKGQGASTSINIADLSAGIYFVKMYGENAERIVKFVKQ